MTSTNPIKKAASATYPEPLVIPPFLEHRQTFIILHGRGSNAQTFGPPLLATQLPNGHTFQAAYPQAKFILPTASKRRAQIYMRSIVHQWFDNWSLSTPTEREELMLDGLRETSQYIHSLLRNAIGEVGAENVVLGGLSQGCAAALISLLTWEGEPLAAVFGMCGWLPLRHHMADIAEPQELSGDDDDDLFGHGDNAADKLSLPVQAVEWLREEINLPVTPTCSSSEAASTLAEPRPTPSVMQPPFQRTPVFLGHGTEDEKVPVQLGREAKDCLMSMEVAVEWREYEGLGHWYSEQMLGDLVDFLKVKTGWFKVEGQKANS